MYVIGTGIWGEGGSEGVGALGRERECGKGRNRRIVGT